MLKVCILSSYWGNPFIISGMFGPLTLQLKKMLFYSSVLLDKCIIFLTILLSDFAGRGVPESDIWNRLLTLAQEPDSRRSDLDITPTLFGERHSPGKHAQVLNITMTNISVGSVFYSLCKGLISNLHSMMSQDCLHAAGIKQIIGSGTALVRNSVLREQIEEHYKLPLVLSEESHADAAVGVALAMFQSL